MFANLEAMLIGYANHLPLEIFAVVASFVEGVVAPIPSPAVMIAVGSLASLQARPFYGLIILCLFGAVGKLLGALLVYFLADKLEDIFSGRFAKFFGVTHEDIESFGKRLGKGWKDYIAMIVVRALPIIPSSLVSVGSGVLKIPLRLYIISTLVGTVARDFIYIYFGYAGAAAVGSFLRESTAIESLIQILAVVAIAALLVFAYYRRKKRSKKKE